MPNGVAIPNGPESFGAGWTPSTGANTDAWQLVDDDPDSADTSDYITHDGSTSNVVRFDTSIPGDLTSLSTTAADLRVRLNVSSTGWTAGQSRIRVALRRSSDSVFMTNVPTLYDLNTIGSNIASPTVYATTLTLTADGLADNTAAGVGGWDLYIAADINSGTSNIVYAARVYFDNYTASSTVPGAVSDLAGTVGDTQVPLTWTAPSDGGAAITDYIVHYRAV